MPKEGLPASAFSLKHLDIGNTTRSNPPEEHYLPVPYESKDLGEQKWVPYGPVQRTMRKVDHYIRREGSALSKAFEVISPKKGSEWRQSEEKRKFEHIATTPLRVVAPHIINYLVKKIDQDHIDSVQAKANHQGTEIDIDAITPPPAIYIQPRMPGYNGTIKSMHHIEVPKLRTMNADADLLPTHEIKAREAKAHKQIDPRVTKIGETLRAADVDEIPQILLIGDTMSLVGIRVHPYYDFDTISLKYPNRAQEWLTIYDEGYPAILSLPSSNHINRKDSVAPTYHRFNRLYASHASLGLDLYIITRTSARIASKIVGKVAEKAAEKFKFLLQKTPQIAPAPELSGD